MVPDASRRQVLVGGGAAATALLGGYALAARSTASPRQPDGWPMVRRDPGGRSFAPEADPPTSGVTVRWQVSFDGRLAASSTPPVVADGRVSAGGDEVLVLDAEDGTVQSRLQERSRSAAAVAPARAYDSPTVVLNGTGGVTGLHATGGPDVLGGAGRRRWHVDGATETTVGFGASPARTPPVVVGDTVLAPGQGSVAAVDASDGTVLWQRDADPVRPAVEDGTVYVPLFGEGVVGYDLETGRQTAVRAGATSARAVTVGDGRIVAATSDGIRGLAVDGTDGWEYNPDDVVDSEGSIALADGTAYAGVSGEEQRWLVALDATDGTELWRSEVALAAEPRFVAPAVAAETVYVPTLDEQLAAVDAADGQVRWRFDSRADQPVDLSPVALVDGTVYVADAEYVYALEEP